MVRALLESKIDMGKAKLRRVLLVGNFISRQRGTRFYCEDLAINLAVFGCSVIVTSTRNSRIMRLLDSLYKAAVFHRRYDVAIVDVYSGLGFWLATAQICALRVLRKPVIAVLHGGGLPDFNKAYPNLIRYSLQLAQSVVTPSFYLQCVFSAALSHVIRIPNAMDLSSYRYKQRSSDGCRICWLRAFDTVYDPVMAVRAFAIVHVRYPSATLTLAGPVKRPELLELTKSEIADAGLLDAVFIIGPVRKQEVPTLMEQHDIFINTTHLESFGVSVMEAAASGLPVVSTDAGEIPYLWRDGEDSLLVPVGDAEAMGKAIIRLLDDQLLRLQVSALARAKAETTDWSRVIPQWIELLDKIFKDHKA